MILNYHDPDYLIHKISTHPERVNLKNWFNSFSLENRKELKLKGLQMLFDNTTYSHELYQLFISKIEMKIPEELELLISYFICPKGHINKIIKLPKRRETLSLLQKISHVF